MTKKRIDWIDIAKGIGVFLVILGHESLPKLAQNWIYSFHMPLFFILSGYTYKRKKSFWEETRNMFKHLLVPYIVYSVVFFLIDILLFGIKSEVIEGDIHSLKNGQGSFGVLWFLLSMFWVRLFYSAIDRKVNEKAKAIIISIIVVLAYLFHLVTGQYLFTITTSLIILGFFYLGTQMKQRDFISKVCGSKKVVLFMAIASFGSILVSFINYSIYGHKVEISGAVYNFLPFTYIAAVCGSVIVVFLSFMIESKHLPFERILKHIGFYSLWYYPLTAFIPNRTSKLVEGTIYDNWKIKLASRLLSFAITFILIMGGNFIKRHTAHQE